MQFHFIKRFYDLGHTKNSGKICLEFYFNQAAKTGEYLLLILISLYF